MSENPAMTSVSGALLANSREPAVRRFESLFQLGRGGFGDSADTGHAIEFGVDLGVGKTRAMDE